MATTATQLTEAGTSRFVQAGGVKLHYNEAGTGPVVIMLHGGGLGASGWSNFAQNIGPFSQRFRVLLVDLPGFGKSDSAVMKEPRALQSGRAINDLMDALDIGKASIIGNSLGGATALNLALEYPDRVEKLVLMGSGGTAVSNFVPNPSEGVKVLIEFAGGPTLEGMRKLFDVMLYDSSIVSDELLQQRFADAMGNTGHLEARKKSNETLMNLTPRLGEITAPTLIVWGRDDRVVPFDGSLQLLFGIANSRLHVFSKCGHWAQLEHAEEFNRLVSDFLVH